MDQPLNIRSKLKIKFSWRRNENERWWWSSEFRVLNPKSSELDVTSWQILKDLSGEYEFVAKNRKELRLGVKG